LKSARKARDMTATDNAPLSFIRRKNIMDVQTISTLISTIGFPIAACCAIFFMMNKEREDHKNEVDTLKDVISNINETLAGLKQLIQDKLN
jgi:hypothetical protein